MPFTFAILAVIISYTWILQPRLPPSGVIAPILAVLAFALWNAARTREWGFAGRAFLPALRAAALFTLPAAGIVLAVGATMGTLHDRRDFLGNLASLAVWGGAQQWVLQTVVLRESQRATSRRAGVLVAALLFGLVHLPNPFLTAMTTIGAVAWCAIYDRYPNVIPLGLSHAVATLAILYAFDDDITGRLRIGYAFWLLDS
jgi:membrane protease YdiL (CAAX protease family)